MTPFFSQRRGDDVPRRFRLQAHECANGVAQGPHLPGGREGFRDQLPLEGREEEECADEVVREIEEEKAEEQKEKNDKVELEEAKEEAEAEVKKVEKKAEDAVKKAAATKEAAPGGIIDVITDVLANHAKV